MYFSTVVSVWAVPCPASPQQFHLVAKADFFLYLSWPSKGLSWISVPCGRSLEEIIFSAFVYLPFFGLKITNNFFLCHFSRRFCSLERNPASRLKLLQTWVAPVEVARSIHWHMCVFFSFGIGFLASESCLGKKEIACCIVPFSLQVYYKIFYVVPDPPWLKKAVEIQCAFLVTEELEVVDKVEIKSCWWVVMSAGCR